MSTTGYINLPLITTGTVTSVAMTVPAFLSISGSPVTSDGTLALTLSGTALPLANGGTGATTKAAAFDALSPMTTGGDLIYGGASGTGTRLANGTAGQVLTSAGTTLAPTWSTPTVRAANEFYTSSSIVGDATVNSNTFATFSNSPAFTVTPVTTGTFKIYSSICIQNPSAQYGALAQIVNTSGGATLLSKIQGYSYSQDSTQLMAGFFIQSVYTLTAGVTYVFDIQGLSVFDGTVGNASATIHLRGIAGSALGPAMYMYAESVGR